MTSTIEVMTLDELCQKYNLNRTVLAFEMKRLKGLGVPEEQFLRYQALKAQGETKFSIKEFSLKLSPKESICYGDYFFLTLRDICREYQVQPSLVKQFLKRGMSFEKAFDLAVKKTNESRPKKVTEKPNNSKEFLDFLNLPPNVRAVIEKHNLDAQAFLTYVKKHNLNMEDYAKELDKVLSQTSENISVNTSTSRSLEISGHYSSGFKRKSKLTIKSLGGDDSPYNANTINNDAKALRMGLNDFVKKLRQYNMLSLYLKSDIQPPFSFRGIIYPNFESFVAQHGLDIIKVRLTAFNYKGNIDRAIAHLLIQQPKIQRKGKAVIVTYRGKTYNSLRELSNAFNIPYHTLVKSIQVCLLPNAPRTVDEVVDELIYNACNNYITVNGRRILLETSKRKYRNISELCQVERVHYNKLRGYLTQGYPLEESIRLARFS